MMPILFTDLDNTLYNWVDYFGPSFRGMVHALAREMKVEEEKLNLGFKQVFNKVGTLDYGFVIQSLPFIKEYTPEQIEKFVETGRLVFSIVRKKNLRAYEGVQSTLEYLTNQGVLIIAVTNAPIYFGEDRLKKLSLDKYFYGIAGWEGTEIPVDEHTRRIIENDKMGKYRSKHISRRWAYSKDEIKPNPFAYLNILSDLKASHKTTYVIGDSISKDLNPADIIGAITIWAKYGTVYEEKNFQTLLNITHWNPTEIKNIYEENKITPKYIVNSFVELREIIKGSQLNLF